MKSPQFANIAQHPDFNEDYVAEIRSLTGDIPRELVLLSEEYGHRRDIGLLSILAFYSHKRRAAFESRFADFEAKYPELVPRVCESLVKFFIQVHVSADDVSLRFYDTGLAYEEDDRVLPLTSNALGVFFKLLNESDGKAWNNEILHELRNLESDNASQVGLAFEKLFALNLLSFSGHVTLNYSDLLGTQQQRQIQIRHFITLPADKPKKSWKDYPAGTLVAHSADGEARLDFIFFGGTDCTLFFEVTVAKDVSKAKYPLLSNDSRKQLILASIGKWMGGSARISDQKQLLPPRNYKGVIEYIIVSSRLPSEGKLSVGEMKKEEFPWLKLMDRSGLEKFFPPAHIQKLYASMTKLSIE